jgi:phosphoserine phosphatase RsbU/P
MTAVAGDFYEFLPVDQHRAGFLVADVSGHGVPAALIASMIKVAAKSVAAWAYDPAEVLRRLSGILSGQLSGQFVSAAYLWIDTETRQARYSAAGHPPLLCWRAGVGRLERIESNGLLFGVLPDSDYPVCDVPLASGDRFLLDTDGVVEPENDGGEAFGDHKLEQVVRSGQSCTASELSERLLSEVRNWESASMTQQDDITLIVIDVVWPRQRCTRARRERNLKLERALLGVLWRRRLQSLKTAQYVCHHERSEGPAVSCNDRKADPSLRPG